MRTRGPEHITLLRRMRLLSGTWQDLLDSMQREEDSFHDILFKDPNGSEGDMFESIFYNDNKEGVSQANRYVCGLTEVNPFVLNLPYTTKNYPPPTQIHPESRNSFLKSRTRLRKFIMSML